MCSLPPPHARNTTPCTQDAALDALQERVDAEILGRGSLLGLLAYNFVVPICSDVEFLLVGGICSCCLPCPSPLLLLLLLLLSRSAPVAANLPTCLDAEFLLLGWHQQPPSSTPPTECSAHVQLGLHAWPSSSSL